MRITNKVTRVEQCTCDHTDCSEVKDVDHNMVAPKDWTQISDLLGAKNYHLCPVCWKKLLEFFKNPKAKEKV
ncbi:Uncharacterised protein [uncultured archaeon]|nr:Uncharacterised protein [uncultured archaeon]